jgi:hypothetical protein
VAAHEQIGLQIIDEIVVRRRQERPNLHSRAQLPQIERQHFRQWPVEHRAEFVGANWSFGARSVSEG